MKIRIERYKRENEFVLEDGLIGINQKKQLAYEEYVNQCGTQPHVSFEVWEKHYDDGTEYLLDEEKALRNGNREPNYERHGH